MTVQLITHPFRLRRDGSVDTAPPGSEEQISSQLAALIGTRVGERPMAHTFGVPDPAFAGLAAADVAAGVRIFGPDGVRITSVVTTPVDEEVSSAVVTWTRA